MSRETHTYRPVRWLRIVIFVTLLVFVAVLFIALKTELKMFYVAVSAFMVLCSVLGLVEMFVSRVDVEADAVFIKGLFRSERIELSQVEKVSADGGRIGLYMKAGKWK